MAQRVIDVGFDGVLVMQIDEADLGVLLAETVDAARPIRASVAHAAWAPGFGRSDRRWLTRRIPVVFCVDSGSAAAPRQPEGYAAICS
jgi:hypothetical protein